MPEKFFVGVGAYIEKGGKVLIVKRHSNSVFGKRDKLFSNPKG